MEKAETIVVSSDKIARHYRDKHQVARLDPFWSEPLADGLHFRDVEKGDALHIAYLGSASHAADRLFTFTVLEGLLGKMPNLKITVFGDHDLPVSLKKDSRICASPPLPWIFHRKRVAALKCHIALCPMLDTPFNRGRSVNKLIEHAVAGGIGVYSAGWKEADQVRAAAAGLSFEDRPEVWVEGLQEAISRKEGLKSIQSNARTLAYRLNDGDKQRIFWQNELEIAAS
ncbi:hypothetical protein HPQ64_12605 [Rhizobiales bacterium]|uniref:hypothetical protein n=1 Tax=Hongsoonwoonella zoysiae TaxID=2821844 RepID=UPI00155FEED1|nr:hypothetical protein [Hongsoonwoonella zoysiae]NRG18530.1 hypothetical protein [Hongsoonwoonella zoysiae]